MGLGYGCSASFQIAEYRDDFEHTEIGAQEPCEVLKHSQYGIMRAFKVDGCSSDILDTLVNILPARPLGLHADATDIFKPLGGGRGSRQNIRLFRLNSAATAWIWS